MGQMTVILVVIALGATAAWIAGSRVDAKSARWSPEDAAGPSGPASREAIANRADGTIRHPIRYPKVVTLRRVTEARPASTAPVDQFEPADRSARGYAQQGRHRR